MKVPTQASIDYGRREMTSKVDEPGLQQTLVSRRPRPPRRKKVTSLRAVLQNLKRDLRVWWKR